MEDVWNVFGHSVYFTAISYIYCPFGIFCDHLGMFFSFGILYQEKSGNPADHTQPSSKFAKMHSTEN
jgi:hypothetical protein